MPFTIQTTDTPVAVGAGEALILGDERGNLAEVWPAFGFNCFRWHAPLEQGTAELLYADPTDFAAGRPTRGGIPVLFPFPNRIRDGRFTWDGKQYQLPTNDPSGKNAIHGFACRHGWRLVGQEEGPDSAFVTGEFRLSTDAPEQADLWPADCTLRLTIRLAHRRLRLEAEVINPDSVPLPFGLGYHPYFRVPFANNTPPKNFLVRVPARQMWQLVDSLPTGQREPVDAARDLNRARPYAELPLDDVLTDLPPEPANAEGLRLRATLAGPDWAVLRLFAADHFRDLVVFTPPHRRAFCVEPYTCTTDAINLQGRGVDAGWRVLAPGQRWGAVIEMVAG